MLILEVEGVNGTRVSINLMEQVHSFKRVASPKQFISGSLLQKDPDVWRMITVNQEILACRTN